MTEPMANVFEAKISFKVLCETIDGVKTARIDNPGFTVGGLDFNLFALCPTENFHGICTYMELTEACKKMLMYGFDIEVTKLNIVPDDKTNLWLSPLPVSTSYGSALLCVVNAGAQCDATLVIKFHDVFPHRLQFVDEEAAKEKMSDCKIVLEDDEDKPVYVVKKVLAMNSPFFKTMFFGDFQEKDQDVVKLGGVSEEEFLEYLCCVYPPPNRPFSFIWLESLYHLADRFQNQVLMTSIKNFMMEKQAKTSLEKRLTLVIADAYDMPELFLATLKTMDKKDLKELSSVTYKKFNRDNIEHVLARIIRLS